MFDKTQLLRKLKKFKAKKIFIQVPEGLKMQVLDIAEFLQSKGFEAFVCIEPCYGACDIRDDEALRTGCDLILHFGHSDFGVKTNVPVIYEEFRVDVDVIPLLKKNLHILKHYKNIALVTTLQYVSALDKVKRFLESFDKNIFIGKSRKTKHPGQVLGCDYSAAESVEAKVDCFLFFGSGRFHPLGLSLRVNKPVLFLDLETGKIENLESEKQRIERIRFMQIEKAKTCKRFGILVSTKPGQARPKLAEKIHLSLRKTGRKAWILVADEIKPEKLLGLDIECLINTACPRITDDFRIFKKPILSPEELEKIL